MHILMNEEINVKETNKSLAAVAEQPPLATNWFTENKSKMKFGSQFVII